MTKKICVYCGSNPGNQPEYLESAKALGRALVERGFGLVYGGASIGVMGILADTVLASGGEVVGIMPNSLAEKEITHPGLSQLFIVDSMHERKSMMADMSDAFIALPGGLGTLEELFEVLTWSVIGLHSKPCALLNVKGYYDPLIAFLDHAVEQGFIKGAHREILLVEENANMVLDLIV